jgi:predicted TIM-barrel fold metal-dependent hydrolase
MFIAPPAVDSHAHVFGSAYPYDPDRLYEPAPTQAGTAAQFMAVLDAHGFSHGLLVQAQPYGRDNRCMLDAITASEGRFKGIALLDPLIGEKDLARMADAGVIGLRMNLMSYGMRELMETGVEMMFARLRDLGWFLQIHCQLDEIVEAAPLLRRSGLRIMIDHFGRPDPARGIDHPGFRTVLEFGRHDNAVIKLSGPFRSSRTGYPFRDIEPFIAGAIEAYTLDRCVWGSDWPYVHMSERVDYGPGLACLGRWLPDERDRRKVLWETPSRLFGMKESVATAPDV